MGKRRLTGGVVMTTDDRSSVDWELLANLRPTSVHQMNSTSSFSEVSYPHPWREFKPLKRERVYNFDAMKLKTKCLKKFSILSLVIVFWNDIRAVVL